MRSWEQHCCKHPSVDCGSLLRLKKFTRAQKCHIDAFMGAVRSGEQPQDKIHLHSFKFPLHSPHSTATENLKKRSIWTQTSTFFCRPRILYHIFFFCIYCPRGLQAVHNLLPDCEVGIHGNQGLKAHCSARDNRRVEHVSGCVKKKMK